MKDELPKIVIIEGNLEVDSSGNLTLSGGIDFDLSNPQVGYLVGKNNDRKLALYAMEMGHKLGERVRYICTLQENGSPTEE